jgi:hypothetical protein
MLTPDDGSRDEGFGSYLQDPDTLMRYDPVCRDQHPSACKR